VGRGYLPLLLLLPNEKSGRTLPRNIAFGVESISMILCIIIPLFARFFIYPVLDQQLPYIASAAHDGALLWEKVYI
jgi:hypothetical protein